MAAHLALYRRLGAYARPYRWHIAGILVLQLLSTPLALLGPLPLKIAVDTVIGSRPLPSWLNPLLPGHIVSSPTALLTVAAGILLATALLGSLQELTTDLPQRTRARSSRRISARCCSVTYSACRSPTTTRAAPRTPPTASSTMPRPSSASSWTALSHCAAQRSRWSP